MVEKTRVKFFGVKAAKYPGASRDGCPADSQEAAGWHVMVGGTSCSLSTLEDFVKHFGDFLSYAYLAGVADAKAETREKLGL